MCIYGSLFLKSNDPSWKSKWKTCANVRSSRKKAIDICKLDSSTKNGGHLNRIERLENLEVQTIYITDFHTKEHLFIQLWLLIWIECLKGKTREKTIKDDQSHNNWGLSKTGIIYNSTLKEEVAKDLTLKAQYFIPLSLNILT